MNNWMKTVASTAFIAVGSLTLASSAYGQGESYEARRTTCEVVADEVRVISNEGDELPFTSTGTMDLEPGESLPSDDDTPARMGLKNSGFSAKSEDPVLGTITWDLDESRPVETSFIRADQVTALFPATIQLDFNVRATISSQPGRVFLSSTPISISTNSPLITDEERAQFPVKSWPPGDIFLGSVDANGNGEIDEADEVQFFDKETGEAAFRVVLRSRVRD